MPRSVMPVAQTQASAMSCSVMRHTEAGHVGDAGNEVDGGHLSDASAGDVFDVSPDAAPR